MDPNSNINYRRKIGPLVVLTFWVYLKDWQKNLLFTLKCQINDRLILLIISTTVIYFSWDHLIINVGGYAGYNEISTCDITCLIFLTFLQSYNWLRPIFSPLKGKSWFLNHVIYSQKLRQTKCLIFKIWRLKFTVIPQKSHLALGIMAKLVFWSILSFKNWKVNY